MQGIHMLKPTALALALSLAALGAQATTTFQEVAASAGIYGDNGSWGHAWADYDRDGHMDILTHAHLQDATTSITQLWRNNGDGSFTDVTLAAGLPHRTGDTHGVVWGDFDKDGYDDLYIVNGSVKWNPDENNTFWRNNGNGTFTEMGEAAGLTGAGARSRGVFAFDYDRDGQLDIFSTSFNRTPADKPIDTDKGNLLFRNTGGLVFSDMGITSGIDRGRAENRAAAWGDYNGDGRPDVLMTGPCGLFAANADGSYSDVTLAAGIDPSSQCAAASWGDYNKDGHLDLYVVKGFSESATDSLYRNNGDGTFTDVAAEAGLTASYMKRAAIWGDVDNDGDLDIYVVALTNGAKPNLLYINNGDGTFTDIAASAGVTGQVAGNGSDASMADFNNDGQLDIFVSNGEGNAIGPYLLFKNDGNPNNHWLKLKLTGKSSNANALMTKVKVEANLGSQYHWNLGPHHFLSQDSLPMHIGLGSDTGVNRLLLDWPRGAKQRIENVAANQTLVLVEGQPHWYDAPKIAKSGFYVWQVGKRWRIAWKGGNGASAFAGKITSTGNFTQVTTKSFETDDSLTWDTKAITFSGNDDGKFQDMIEFETTGRSVTFNITQDGVAQPASVYLGKNLIKPATLPLTLRR